MRPTALRNRLFGGVLALALTAPIAARAELRVVDRTPQKGGFSLTNSTGTTIRYQVRWGNQNAWKPMTLESGRVMTHSHPLSAERRAPTPYVRFDKIGGDGAAITLKEYRMGFHAVGGGGEPKKFVFRYAPNGRDLDVKAQP
jgi:hypothetical protein